jgi:hypothetical protein
VDLAAIDWAAVPRHPVPPEALRAIRTARFLVDRFWAPVGSGVQPEAELRFLATYLFGGPEGRAAARKVDETIRRLPGFETVQLLESWMDRHARRAVPPR